MPTPFSPADALRTAMEVADRGPAWVARKLTPPVTPQAVVNWKAGRQAIPADRIPQLENALNLAPGTLAGAVRSAA